MNLTCPVCGARCSIEAHLTDEAARRAVAAALKLPAPLGDLVLRYVGLFRPPSGRMLTWDRSTRLIEELSSSISSAKVSRRGRTYSAPLDYWRGGLEAVLDARDRLTLPLRSHGYLYEIVSGIAHQIESRDESRMEAERARTSRPFVGGDEPRASPVAVHEHIKAALRRLKGVPDAST